MLVECRECHLRDTDLFSLDEHEHSAVISCPATYPLLAELVTELELQRRAERLQ